MNRNCKSTWSFVIFVLSVLFYMGCSNDFEINAPAKDIPVVYGLLSKADDVHYIRVERAFLEADQDALALAQLEDQLYYGPEVTVSLKNLTTDEEFLLNRINAVDDGIIRDSGIFLEDPNILYTVSNQEVQLNENDSYQLIINRGNSLPIVTASTHIVGDMELSRPFPNSGGLREISFLPNRSTAISVTDDPAHGASYDVIFTIRYFERLTSDVTFEAKSLEWKAISESENIDDQFVSGLDFYSFLAGSLGSSTLESTTRRMSTIDLKFVAGGQEISNFRGVIRANAGISGAEDAIPNYTNLSEGRGLFSSRNILIEEGFSLTGESFDSLTTSSLTRDLNFIQ